MFSLACPGFAGCGRLILSTQVLAWALKPAGGMGNFLGPKLQDEIESGSKCGACPRIIIGTIVNPHITG